MHNMNDAVIELHVHEDDRNVMQMLQTFCDQNRIQIIRIFWRGLEPEDKEVAELWTK